MDTLIDDQIVVAWRWPQRGQETIADVLRLTNSPDIKQRAEAEDPPQDEPEAQNRQDDHYLIKN